MTIKLNTDIAIIGGGIAGLWLGNTLKKHGFNVVVIEKYQLGSGQTICSQGIIHGGLKYSLQGLLSKDSLSLQQMPDFWNSCFNGHGEIDLSATTVLSYNQYMFAQNMHTKLQSLFASMSLRSLVQKVPKSRYPSFFGKDSSSVLYSLTEKVVDIASALATLAKPLADNLIKVDDLSFSLDPENNIKMLNLRCGSDEVVLTAKKYIATAGIGNAELCNLFPKMKMQRRPLQMTYVISNDLPRCYCHFIGVGTTPKLTLTTHYTENNVPVWYLGGSLAEQGVQQSSAELIIKAKKMLAEYFPKVKLKHATWDTVYIERAEAATKTGIKPQSATILKNKNAYICWPTKLALAPVLAQKMLSELKTSNVHSSNMNPNLQELPKPQVATYPWSHHDAAYA